MSKSEYIKDSLFERLKAELPVPKEFLFADEDTFYTMLRNIFRGKWILVTGPSGCGKSHLAKVLSDYTKKPFYPFNFGDTMNPSAKLLGDTKYSKEEGTMWNPSRFVSALQDPTGAFVLLDEVTRDRTGDLANILMPVLDGQRYLALDESDDAGQVGLDEGCFFFATANIGRDYLGAAHDLDRAWKDRFTGGMYHLNYLPKAKEQKLVMERNPTTSTEEAEKICDFAEKIRQLYMAEELNTAVSTRMVLEAAGLVGDGLPLLDALKHVCLPFYPVEGTDDTEQQKVLQALQAKV
tara:strand:+ start:1278 stop:2159 length:882 start_codon:yes stop_codon:yes gene_type:complete